MVLSQGAGLPQAASLCPGLYNVSPAGWTDGGEFAGTHGSDAVVAQEWP